ncbi:LysM peptidoglycan-binding domain-containing M23 family metallopeptidase [Streptomyces sp. GXMU-J15]|uniref:LysM peptidoglycan-binding domain-containing M23 family metallopeptidase n=1 Tax=Streptomyces fuscus TaxID=3048495 RepID=A0ABT7J2K1_9ACTN|nr:MULTISPECIES: LysM peptidoglycan-binding domain-containing M23 family metallopeptidase [Streptomyces]MDL2078582.1 LysM peptidoglycan-binding domain-containing M23 family metallopeptidase [Streptomyces fuscus]SBT88140.1 Murein DD-endopeptidase MepM and murein hydrolase activator NlpD, contain LysM domain [Streptomyces sp. DI166]
MPAKGKHRRPKTLRLTRGIAAAGTGGAALALPLLGATGAHAAPSQSVPEKAVQSVQSTKSVDKKETAKKSAKKSATKIYTVRSGDYLSKIADEQDVRGGWQKLYQDNREAVGDDPSLIHPGLKLSINKKAASTDRAEKSVSRSATRSAAKPAAPAKPSAPAQSSAPQAAPTTAQAAPAAATGFSAPVAGAGVGTGYKVAGSMWSSGYHTGADFVVPSGTPLKAVGAGTVVSAGWAGAYGNQVVIRLADGHYAQYAHLSSLSVSSGQSVTAGQQVGLSGSTGNSTGPHLHFEIRTTPNYGSDVDPIAYLRAKGVSIG